MPDRPRLGSWCTGYGGLDHAVEAVFGTTTAWTSDIDPGAARIIAHRMPGVPNLGDLTATDWQAVLDQHGPVDIVTGGYPCQPFSVAGRRKGTEDDRHIWPYIADALRVLRPRLAIFENVSGHLRLGFDTVLADLARLGFDAQWCLVRASEVGAPHRRERLFILATAQDPDSAARGQRRLAAPGQTKSRGTRADAGGRGRAPAADTRGPGLEVRTVELDRDERQAAERGRGQRDWGAYAPAVTRWESVTGRRAPWATDDRRRLTPMFVEWLMGLGWGHVTHVPGLTRNEQLKALGNGVVPQQAEAAIRHLYARAAA